MEGKSIDIQQIQIEKLKELFAEAVSEGKVDWEKLKTNTVLQMRDAGVEFKTI